MRRIDSQIFDTPTGRTYDPSESIYRSSRNTANQITGIMEQEHQRQKAEEDAFNQIYANLGEIEGELQQNYAGAFQEMVDATKNDLKEHLKAGGRVNDPEFQMKYNEKLSRIKAGKGNADNIIKQIDQNVKSIAENPYMTWEGKRKATQEMLAMAQNRDVLISKNPVDFSGIANKHVNPELVFKDAYLSLPSMGEVETSFDSDKGDLMSRSIILNDLIDPEKPFTEDGRPNVKFDVPRYMEIMQNNPTLTEMADRIRQQSYANEPYDVGMSKALRDGFMSVAPMTQKTKIMKTADQRKMEAGRENRANRNLDLQYNKEARMLAKERAGDKKEAEMLGRWDSFVDAYESSDPNQLQQYVGKGIKNFRFKTDRDLFKNDLDAVSTDAKWEKLSKEKRFKLLEELGIEIPKGFWGQTASDSEEARLAAKEALESKVTGGIVGIAYDEKEGTVKGSAQMKEQFIPINGREDLEGAFVTLERILGTTKPTVKTGDKKEEPKDPKNLMDIF